MKLAALIFFALMTLPARSAEPLPVRQVAPGVYVHEGEVALASAANRGGIANIGFIVGRDGVAVVDTGGSPSVGRDLLAAVRRVTRLPVSYVINTHMHPDHVFGNAAFRGAGRNGADPVFVGHANLGEALSRRAAFYVEAERETLGALLDDIEIVVPDRAVGTDTTVDLGGRRVALRAWRTAHTNNDLTVLDEATGTLFAGDLVFMRHLPVIDGSLLGWLAIHPELAGLPARRVVPGHGPASAPWPDALEPQRRYLEELAEAIRPLIAAGVPMADAVDSVPYPAGWDLTHVFHRRNVATAFGELEWE